ncbi:MAG: hypothetical protein ACM34K_05375 [Bacillota bacterium]
MKQTFNIVVSSGSILILAGLTFLIFNLNDTGAAIALPVVISGVFLIFFYLIFVNNSPVLKQRQRK